jgi:hypothetical protein
MPDLNQLIEADLQGLSAPERIVKMASLIEFYGQQVPAVLAQMRAEEVRALSQEHTAEEIRQLTGIGPGRQRKLVER